jgi:histone H3/H4
MKKAEGTASIPKTQTEEETSATFHPQCGGAISVATSLVVQKHALSRAAVRRLAHDAGVRMMKDHYDPIMDALVQFLRQLFGHSQLAMQYSKKKSVGVEHVHYALRVLKFDVPEELLACGPEELRSLRKCNVHASADVRKRSALSAEISEASFSRLSREVAAMCNHKTRITCKARHLIQLVCEIHLVRLFAEKRVGAPVPFRSTTAPRTYHPASALGWSLLKGVEGPQQDRDASIILCYDKITSQIPFLLEIGSTKTVDERLIVTAVRVACPELPLESLATEDPPLPETTKTLTKILRGLVVDKRITAGAVLLFAKVLKLVALDEAMTRGNGAPALGAPPPNAA